MKRRSGLKWPLKGRSRIDKPVPANLSETARSTFRGVLFGMRLVGTVLGLAFLVWVLSRQAWFQMWHLVRTLPRLTLALALTGFVAGQVFNTLRWWALLYEHRLPLRFRLLFRLTWTGYLTSNFLPGSIGGDGLRSMALLPYVPRPSMAFASVVLDRLLNLSSMLCLLPMTFWTFRQAASVRITWRWGKGALFLTLLTGLLLGAYLIWKPWRTRWKQWLYPWVRKPEGLLWGFLWAWMSNLTQIGSIYVLARGIGMPVSYGQVMGVHVLIYLLVLLPISLNGLGVAESAYVVLYPLLGATPEQATVLALLARFLPLLVLLPGAFWLPSVLQEAAVGIQSLRPEERSGGGL